MAGIEFHFDPDDPWRPGPRAFAPPEYRAGYALSMLTTHYWDNPQFMHWLSDIHSQHTDVVHFLRAKGKDLGLLLAPSISDLENLDLSLLYHPNLSGLIMATQDFTGEWGLNAPWALGLLLHNLAYWHQCESDAGVEIWRGVFSFTNAYSWPAVHEESPAPEWDPVVESRQYYSERIVEYMHDVEERLKEAGMVPHGGKSELDTYIGWLYERIALRLTPTQIWDKQCNDPHPVGLAAIERGIGQVAKLLKIE